MVTRRHRDQLILPSEYFSHRLGFLVEHRLSLTTVPALLSYISSDQQSHPPPFLLTVITSLSLGS
jgi:hypothetical protein